MAAQKAQLLLKFAHVAQVAAKEAGRAHGLPQVAVGAWEGLQGLQAPGSHADAGVHHMSGISSALNSQLQSSLLGQQLPSAASLLHSQHQLHSRDIPVLEQVQHSHFGGPIPHLWDGPATEATPHITLPHSLGAGGSALMPPRCVPDAASSSVQASMGPRNGKQQQGGRQGQQQQHGRRGRAHSSSSVGLNKQIMTANSTGELLSLVRQHGASFDFFNISTAIARVPKLVGPHGCGGQMDPTCKALVDDLAKLMEQHIDAFDARGLANAAWALGRLRYAGPSRELPGLIAGAARNKLGEFCAQNIANTLWALVYMHHRSEPLLRAAAQQVISKACDFKPQELANLVWAYASLEFRDDAMLQAVARRAHSLANQFNEQELSNLIWGLGKLRYGDAELYDHLLRCVASKLHAFTPQGVANVAWGIATAGHRDVPLFRSLLAKCVRELPANDVQGLANMMWAAGALGVRDEVFMAAAAGECCRRVDDLSPQQLANALWACGTLGWSDPRTISRLADAVAARSGGFEPQALSNCAWALAKLGASGGLRSQVFEALAAAALPKARAFTAQGCSNLLWAFATANHSHPRLFDAITHQVIQRIDSFNAQNCGVAAWACASARYYSPALCNGILNRVLGTAAPGKGASNGRLRGDANAGDGDLEPLQSPVPMRVEPQNLANLLWALARLGHPVKPGSRQAEALRETAADLMPRMARQELCNSGWALAALGLMDAGAWGAFCSSLVAVKGLSSEDLQQAFHAQLLAQASAAGRGCKDGRVEDLPDSIDDAMSSSSSNAALSANSNAAHSSASNTSGASAFAAVAGASAPAPRPFSADAPVFELPEPLKTLAQRCWCDNAAAAAAPNGANRVLCEIAAALEAAGARCALGQRTADGMLHTELSLEVDGHCVAIEAHGPHYYSSNEPRRALGDADARKRLLGARGLRVVEIAQHEWDTLPSDLAARAAALLHVIDEELGHPAWSRIGPPADATPAEIDAAHVAAQQAAAAVQHDALLYHALLQQQEQQAAVLSLQHQQQKQDAQARSVEIATGEMVQLLLRQQAAAQEQQHQQQAALQYMHPVRRISAEAGNVAAMAAAAVLADCPNASNWMAAEQARSPLAAQNQQPAPHAGLASLLYGGAAAPGGLLPLGVAVARAPGAPFAEGEGLSGWSGGHIAHDPLPEIVAPHRLAAPRPDDLMLGFGWGGGIWGRP